MPLHATLDTEGKVPVQQLPEAIIGPPGPQGEPGLQGPQGDPGPPGTTTWDGITDKPGTFPPSTHDHTGLYEPANSNIQTHVGSVHAPANAQKNSDITKAEIEAVLTGAVSSHSHAGGSSPTWSGKIIGCMGDGNPNDMLQMIYNSPVHATPTNITVSIARCSFFRPAADITVNTIRFFGVGATTGVYHVAIYRHSDRARLTADLSPNTAAQAWGTAATGLNLTLTAGTLYFVAVSVDTAGTTAGMACLSSTTGRIGVLPVSWPGNLDIDLASPIINPVAFCQFAVSTGALPNPAATLALQAAWTGGMPAIFLDNA